jgi:hypothetical protein
MALLPKSVRVDGVFHGWLNGQESEAVLTATIQHQWPTALVTIQGEVLTPIGEDEPPVNVQTVLSL